MAWYEHQWTCTHTQKNVVLKKNGSKREELQRVNLSIITVKMYYLRTVHL